MASPYLAGGSKPGFAGKAGSLATNEKPAPVKVVKVRAHTRTIPVKQAAPVKQPAAAKPKGETLGHSILRMRNQKFTDGQIAGQIQKWHPNLTPQQVSTVMERAPKQLPGQRLGAMFVGLPRDYGQGHLFEPKPYNPQQGHAAAPPVQNLHVGDPLGVVSGVKDVGKFVHHPGVGTGLGAGLAAVGFFPGAKALRGAAEAAKALTAGEDVAKVAEAAKGAETAAKVVPKGPKLASAPAEAADLRGALKGARTVRGKQEAGYSVERAKRAAAANVHLTNTALPPDERLRLAKNELKGELPKIDFQGMKVLDSQALTKLQTHILDHPHLMPFQKITASTALANAMAGKVPTKGELTLLEHVFGKNTADSLGQIHNHPFKDTLLSALNVPRSIMASFDMSAPFRQGLMVSTRHPKIFAQNFKPMIKAFGSERVYKAALEEIRARPTYPMMMEAKLSLTDLGRDIGSREEQFASNLAEKIPVAGHGVRASGRAYTGFLDKTRADVFDHLINTAKQQGLNVQDPKFLKSLGTYINSATGRGDLGHFQEAGKVLNSFLFSPRLLASRLNFLNPLYYKRLTPFARKEALRSAVQLAGTLSTVLALASRVPGVKVVTDPRNPDWGKIKLGNTRIDIAGGFQQHLRLLAQLVSGTAISSTTGKRLNLTANQFGKPNRLDLFLRFFEGKEAPIASLVTDFLRNSNQVGQPFNARTEIASRMIPLLAQDSYDLYKQKHGGMNGLAAAFGGYAVGSVGLGLQTYGPQKPAGTTKPQSYFSTKQSGGSPYLSPSSKRSGSPYLK